MIEVAPQKVSVARYVIGSVLAAMLLVALSVLVYSGRMTGRELVDVLAGCGSTAMVIVLITRL